ncbi:MAG: hypothetical protein HPY57_14910 [Ignavibacteria bacterium]|nr:hypothetical protein [Ignavibacteria bacterium]
MEKILITKAIASICLKGLGYNPKGILHSNHVNSNKYHTDDFVTIVWKDYNIRDGLQKYYNMEKVYRKIFDYEYLLSIYNKYYRSKKLNRILNKCNE